MDKVKYSVSNYFEELTISINQQNIDSVITSFSSLDNGSRKCLELEDGNKKFEIYLDINEKHYSKYRVASEIYKLSLSVDSFAYLYHFLSDIDKTGYANVNHIHLYFSHKSLNEFALTIFIEDESLVKWDDKIIE